MTRNIPIVFGQADPGPAPRPAPRINDLQVKTLEKLKAERESVIDRLGWIEEEISDLHREQDELEERQVELESEIEDISAIQREALPLVEAWEDDFRWACGCCPWETLSDNDSTRFRAERHAQETGHLVQLLPADGVPGFDQAVYEVAS